MTTTEETTETVETPTEDEQVEAPAEAVADPQEAAEPVEDDPQEDPGAEDDPKGGKLLAEAKKFKKQAREAQAERDSLAVQVEQMQRNQAESLLGDVLQKPSSLWITGATPADFFDAAGNIDRDALEAAAQGARTEHGLAGISQREAFAPGFHADTPASTPPFARAFAPK